MTDPAKSLSILMPCHDQHPEFLVDALASVQAQTSRDWELLVIVDPDSPPEVSEVVLRRGDARMRIIEGHGGFARGLNDGLRAARSPFVSILLSDDRYDPRAVASLLSAIARNPAVDFFHTGRRYIDAEGCPLGEPQAPVADFGLDYFKTWGSPVKHILCFRRDAALGIGGMDESLSPHGCDDFDFPWRMAQAGHRFRAVNKILYEYRRHSTAPRLTTGVTVEEQVATLETMFAKRGVGERDTRDYLQRALASYLTPQHGYRDEQPDARFAVRCFSEAGRDRELDFRERGFKQRHFFPHRVLQLPKGGPDGLRLAEAMCGITDPAKLWELVLYATGSEIDEFPDELFFDRELVWHEQHFGVRGQVASANVVLGEGCAFGMVYISDLVQRAGRRREFKTRIENRFKGWERLLLNALGHFAADREIPVLYSPMAELALEHTDSAREVGAALFERIYDRAVCEMFDVRREGRWWRIEVERNRGRLAPLDKRFETARLPKTIGLCHDTERGFGHRPKELAFAQRADELAPAALVQMAAIERSLAIRTTYSVVGCFLEEVRPALDADGHDCAFHSYDHRIERLRFWERAARRLRMCARGVGGTPSRPVAGHDRDQLRSCRGIDYRLKGYRAPQSHISPGLCDANLCFFNFEWFASSAYSFEGRTSPFVENGIVKIPILFDDHDLYSKGVSYPEWEERALAAVADHEFVALGLHDCYAEYWLPHYEGFLRKLRELGRISTFGEIAAETTLASARWV